MAVSEHPALRRRARFGGKHLVGAIVALGIVGTLLVLNDAHHMSPVTSATNAAPPKAAPTLSTAATTVLTFQPDSTQGTATGSVIGNPLGAVMLSATGNNPAQPGQLPGSRSVRHNAQGGYDVVFQIPVNVTHLTQTGEIRMGLLPGSSRLAKGQLSVTTPGGHVYAIQMNPTSHIATFQFQLGPHGTRLVGLNWNATAVLQQTDASNPIG